MLFSLFPIIHHPVQFLPPPCPVFVCQCNSCHNAFYNYIKSVRSGKWCRVLITKNTLFRFSINLVQILYHCPFILPETYTSPILALHSLQNIDIVSYDHSFCSISLTISLSTNCLRSCATSQKNGSTCSSSPYVSIKFATQCSQYLMYLQLLHL